MQQTKSSVRALVVWVDARSPIAMTQESKREQLLALRGLGAAACRPGAGPAVLLDISALHGVLRAPPG